MSANLRAFLAVVRWCEGTSDENGYRALYGHLASRPKLFDSFSDHPRQYFDTPWGKTSAAGAYQFLTGTWDDARRALNLPDFSPESQDQAAVWLIQRRGALQDVESGDLDSALAKCGKEWASLPGSPYGQPTRTVDDCRRVYIAAGGTLMQAGPTSMPETPPIASPPTPAPAPAPYIDPMESPEERRAREDWDRRTRARTEPDGLTADVPTPSPVAAPVSQPGGSMPLPVAAVVGLGAELLKLLPFAQKPQKSDQIEAISAQLLKLAQAAAGPGAVNEQAAVDTVRVNPQARTAFVSAAATQWADIAPALEFDARERKEARSFVSQMTGEGPEWRQVGTGLLIGVLSLMIVGGGGTMFWRLLTSEGLDPGQKGLILGALLAAFATVVGFWFGSSASSAKKDSTIAEQARR